MFYSSRGLRLRKSVDRPEALLQCNKQEVGPGRLDVQYLSWPECTTPIALHSSTLLLPGDALINQSVIDLVGTLEIRGATPQQIGLASALFDSIGATLLWLSEGSGAAIRRPREALIAQIDQDCQWSVRGLQVSKIKGNVGGQGLRIASADLSRVQDCLYPSDCFVLLPALLSPEEAAAIAQKIRDCTQASAVRCLPLQFEWAEVSATFMDGGESRWYDLDTEDLGENPKAAAEAFQFLSHCVVEANQLSYDIELPKPVSFLGCQHHTRLVVRGILSYAAWQQLIEQLNIVGKCRWVFVHARTPIGSAQRWTRGPKAFLSDPEAVHPGGLGMLGWQGKDIRGRYRSRNCSPRDQSAGCPD